jgi:transmembrane sensor
MSPEDAKNLLTRYAEDKCSEREIAVVHTWYNEMIVKTPFREELYPSEDSMLYTWDKLMERRREMRSRKARIIIYEIVAAAAMMISMIMFVLPRVSKHWSKNNGTNVIATVENMPPGGDRGTLSLSDGTTYDLAAIPDGQLKLLQGLSINKLHNRIILQRVQNDNESNAGAVNTLSVPYGGQYSIALEDGSIVYLNAGSTLTFPASFDKNRRAVLHGEGYFEIAKDAEHPFVVASAHQKLTVMGTAFNISAYDGENVVTALVNGSVSVQNETTGKRQILSPGDQLSLNDKESVVSKINTDDVTGWKDGKFIFNQTPLEQVLKQFGRWYNVKVDMTHIDGNRAISGMFNRSDSLNNVLSNIRNDFGIKLKLDSRTIKTE